LANPIIDYTLPFLSTSHKPQANMRDVEYDSEDDTLEDLYDGEDDADAEADMDDDPDALLNMAPGEGADDATEDGDDVCVPRFPRSCILDPPIIELYHRCRTLRLTIPTKRRKKKRTMRMKTKTSHPWTWV